MLANMSASTFYEWQQYYSIEPFGEYRSELRHGQHMALTANINRDSKVRPEPFSAQDFMNFVERPKPADLSLEEEQARIDKEVFGL